VRIESAEIVTGPDAKAANSLAQPERVRAVPMEGAVIRDGRLLCQLPPLSFAAVTVELK
jgi:alpha-L-arabinofuranosidase